MSNEFKGFAEKIRERVDLLFNSNTKLYAVDVDKDKLWEKYLESYPEGSNPLYIKNTTHDCSTCRSFVKRFGNVVAIKGNKIQTIWDIEIEDEEYSVVAKALDKFVKSHGIANVFVTNERVFGCDHNIHQDENNNIIRFHHFVAEIPREYVTHKDRIGTVQGEYRATHDVFKRGLEEITLDALETVAELIKTHSVYRGEEWRTQVNTFIKYKQQYNKLKTQKSKDLFVWENMVKESASVTRINNHSIGELLNDLSEGIEVERAINKYETTIVAPENFKRSRTLFTEGMAQQAIKTLEEEGYKESLPRRFATIEDISINDVLFSNRDSMVKMKKDNTDDILASMVEEVKSTRRTYKNIKEISISDFISEVLPTTEEIEVYVEGKHERNLMSLIAPKDAESKTMFKWNNNFSWAYKGNLTDSSLKENVKRAGGSVDGILRFSLQWNDIENDGNDLDAHAIEPDRHEIMYTNRGEQSRCGGTLDTDVIHPKINGDSREPAVENIIWEKSKFKDGTYKLFVECYSFNAGRSGFRAEVEFNGEIYEYNYTVPLKHKERVQVAEVTYKNGEFKIVQNMHSRFIGNAVNKEIWNVKTHSFVPVSAMMFSPNYWEGEQGTGNKHVFFMLKGCINEERPNAFYNEFLSEELYKHRKFMEQLGSRLAVEESENQLSGLGFSLSQKNDLIVKVKTKSMERQFKIIF